MSRLLLTWSDRSAMKQQASHHGTRPPSDHGPVLRLLNEPESDALYDKAIVLTTEQSAAAAELLIEQMRCHIPIVEARQVQLRDPSNYSELFQALESVVAIVSRTENVDIIVSAGTPQMQTLWFVLVKSGLLRARMLQVVPATFVPSVHPKAIREVELDIEGFPEIRALKDEIVRVRGHSRIVRTHLTGKSKVMRDLANRIGLVAPSELPVLIQGETGTGKELVARSIHESSHRAAAPLISENCGALTESVLASELFGHEKGAFTGAAHTKRGLFEVAHGGTLFLDEVGELSPTVQRNLLRVLENGSLRRLGGERTIQVDVRIVAATHRDLLAMVREGSFRQDLYYRLQGATLLVPALRDRVEDLEALVSQFLEEATRSLRITREAWHAIENYSWPGNVRELRSEVMRWQVFCEKWVRLEDLHFRDEPAATGNAAEEAPVGRSLAELVGETERSAIAEALRESGRNLSKSARILEIDRNTLKRKIHKYGL
ncbi:MAG: sigma 54-interacting transcriptional regulator [Kofleriaceae bacterium]|nr:sigma 54-interacting transcriptional regulator [Kofleriaceae bacterium]